MDASLGEVEEVADMVWVGHQNAPQELADGKTVSGVDPGDSQLSDTIVAGLNRGHGKQIRRGWINWRDRKINTVRLLEVVE